MKTLNFIGYSDDTFGEYNVTQIDVDNCASGNPIQCKITNAEETEGLVVIGQYNRFNNGCWDIGICQLDEDIDIPNWNMRFASDSYSVLLFIDVPDDAKLTFYNCGKEIM